MLPTAASDLAQYHLTLSDGTNTVGLMLRSEGAIRRLPRSAGVERKIARQTTWGGGRGNERFVTDTSRFADSSGLWTMQHNFAYLAPVVHWTKGVRNWTGRFPAAVYDHLLRVYDRTHPTCAYRTIPPNTRYASPFLCRETHVAGRIRMLVRGRGTLQIELCADSGGNPGAVLTTSGIMINSVFFPFLELGFFESPTLNAGSTYWVVIRETGGTNELEVGSHFYENLGRTSTDGGVTWTTTNTPFYAMIVDAPAAQQTEAYFFEYKYGLYCYRNTATNMGALFLNGDRGILSDSVGNIVTDATKLWTEHYWVGCVLMISGNSNLVGESRRIVGNTTNSLHLHEPFSDSVANAEYVILGSDVWTERADGTVNEVASCPVVCSDIVYFPMGNRETIRRYREYNNAGVWTIEFSPDAAHNAHHLIVGLSPDNVLSIWRFTNNDPLANRRTTWARADAVTTWTNLSFGTIYPLGDNAGTIESVTLYDGKIYVGRSDGIWGLANDGVAVKVPIEMTPVRQKLNTRNMKGWNTNLYFPVSNGLERLYGSVVDDIGPNRDNGLPVTRSGRIMDFCPVLGNAYICVDAGNDGFSSILATQSPGGAWHELFRAQRGARIRNLFYQTIPFVANRLWFSCGDDLCYMLMPKDMLSPLNDSGDRITVTWEGHLITSWMDFDEPALEHFFDRVTFQCRDLDGYTFGGVPAGSRIAVFYQVDRESNPWLRVGPDLEFGTFVSSPIGAAHNVTGGRIRFLLRFNFAGGSHWVGPKLQMIELRGNEMNEVLYDYTMDIRLEDRLMLLNGSESTQRAADVIAQLQAWQASATPLTMRSIVPIFDNIRGHIDPVSLVPVTFERDEARLVGGLTFKQI